MKLLKTLSVLNEKFRDVDGWAMLENPSGKEAAGFMRNQELRGLTDGETVWAWMSNDGTHSQGRDVLRKHGYMSEDSDDLGIFVVSVLGPEDYPRMDEYWRQELKPYGRYWVAHFGNTSSRAFQALLGGLKKIP